MLRGAAEREKETERENVDALLIALLLAAEAKKVVFFKSRKRFSSTFLSLFHRWLHPDETRLAPRQAAALLRLLFSFACTMTSGKRHRTLEEVRR